MPSPAKRCTLSLLFLLAMGCTHLGVTKEAQGESRPDGLVAVAAAGIHGMAMVGGQLVIADSYGNLNRGRPRGLHVLSGDDQWEDLLLTGSVPSGMEAAANVLYVCDTGSDTVSVLSTDFAFLSFFQVPTPWNVDVGPDDKVYAVSANGGVYELVPAEPARLLFDGLDAPFDLAVTGAGDFWISEQGAEGEGRVTLRDRRGRVLRSFAGLANPEGLVLAENGVLWIADTGADKIYKVVGDALELVRDQISYPIVGLETDDGEIWFNGAVSGVYGIYRIHAVEESAEEREAS